ncbi:type II toxin-antitoxin system HicB family antitoxin [Clostridium botulinum]|uniref:type II toxin-antitoxin system HicB family antitoxin n=1 Tax=Clostridium botulinum TaxID=1491 RepID=UPI0002F2EE15|nr:type II toxin-antitoxin system HicB family antitoxin [Clostridium botulinum]MCD3202840.1 type II toxin-antitoxin system HicB family antitoxin [Clostridium botulinum C/D]MCD3230872.1 type II toxin-antitoxin system HicB family antitoxin [Clostridium botulinum C/D]MCD3253942.1 type II toxin-antitoxin system HicB family antitoxin [Clostridium botulinum C/D]MCD3279462.1 type II toxin-antitoxin system HicB family antitoxin [Clostridium botulinum C/D]MCD3282767.1 type II toxin-antitoxin system Hic
MDTYIYSAIFKPCEEGGYCVTFPDLPGCITEGDNLKEAMDMAKDALELHLWGMEEDKDPIPTPTAPERIKLENKKTFIVPIEAYMPLIRNELANKAVKKTLTIPYWMNKIAESQKINFSQVLQVALKEQLGIKEQSKF